MRAAVWFVVAVVVLLLMPWPWVVVQLVRPWRKTAATSRPLGVRPRDRRKWVDLPPRYTPCAAHPGTNLVHVDGPCQCFFGGPVPEFAPEARS